MLFPLTHRTLITRCRKEENERTSHDRSGCEVGPRTDPPFGTVPVAESLSVGVRLLFKGVPLLTRPSAFVLDKEQGGSQDTRWDLSRHGYRNPQGVDGCGSGSYAAGIAPIAHV
jgi:hypothetical protein